VIKKTALFGSLIMALFVIGMGISSYAQTPELFSYNKITMNTLGTDDGTTIGFGEGDLFGYKSTNMGDLDNNGAEDFATIAFGATNNGVSELGDGKLLGNSYLVLMNPDSTVKESYELSNCATVDETRETRTFGENLDYLGVINDKHTLLIADYWFNKIHVLSIDPADYTHTCSTVTVSGLNDLGWPFTVAGTLDVDNNGDSIPDLIVAGATGGYRDVVGTNLYALDLDVDVNSNMIVTSQLLTVNPNVEFFNNWNNRIFENTVVVEIDGNPSTLDLVLGEPRDFDGGPHFNGINGYVHVAFIDKATFNIERVTTIEFQNLELAINQNTVPHFGIGLANMGDLDGDGIDDIAVGIEGADIGNINSGAVAIMFLNADGTTKSIYLLSNDTLGVDTLQTKDLFGKGLETIDLDGEGLPELVASAHQDNTGGTNAGAVYVFNFTQNFAQNALTSAESNLPFSQTITSHQNVQLQTIDFDVAPEIKVVINTDGDDDTSIMFGLMDKSGGAPRMQYLDINVINNTGTSEKIQLHDGNRYELQQGEGNPSFDFVDYVCSVNGVDTYFSDGSEPQTRIGFTPHVDEGITCTFDYTRNLYTAPPTIEPPTLEVVMNTVSEIADNTFTFTLQSANTLYFDIVAVNNTGSIGEMELVDGERYLLQQNTFPPGFEFTSFDCTVNGEPINLHTGTPTRASFYAHNNENIVCTYLNTDTVTSPPANPQ